MLFRNTLASVLFLGTCLHPAAAQTGLVVAADGSGNYKTVQEAVNAAPANSRTRFVIRIKPGTYKEHIVVPHAKPFLSFVGDDPKTTILTDDRSANMTGASGKPLGTFRTPSTTVEADDFTAENITFENSAGPGQIVAQAVALAVIGDRDVFRNCRFLGSQDTLLTQSGRQYFENSYIEGGVDFIFGGSTAYFDHCHIHAKSNGYITAASTPRDQPYGYVFSRCRISGDSGVKTDLGRPWRPDAAVIFLYTEMSEVVRPAGWNNWSKPERESTAHYAEYRSTGPGANPNARVPWARQLLDKEAGQITIENVLGGADGWNPKTGSVRIAIKLNPAREKMAVTRDRAFLALTGAGFAYSVDGVEWKALSGAVSDSQKIDHALARSPNGVFHTIWAAGGKRLGYAASKDLTQWSAPRFFDVMPQADAIDMQSPALFYDDLRRQFIIFWSSTIRENFFQSYQEPVDDNPRLWFATTTTFDTLTPSKVLFEPGYAVRSGVLLADGSRYALVHEDSRRSMRALRVSFAPTPFGPWSPSSGTFAPIAAPRPNVVRGTGEWLIYQDQILATKDFWTFSLISDPRTRLPFTSMIELPGSALDDLLRLKTTH